MSRFVVIAAVLAAATLLWLPPATSLSPAALAVAATGIVMAALWMTEALPLAATALLPLVIFPLLGVMPLDALGRSYAHPLIFLFLGGFMLAAAIERWGLHRRLALAVMRLAGKRPSGVLAAVMAATAFLSLWISNTASAMVMAPIAAAIAAREGANSPFATALMLGVAYAATIGGMGSLIGTPPNALFAAYMAESHGIEIGFADWLAVGLPVVAIMLPAAWLLLGRALYRLPDSFDAPPETALPPWTTGERLVAIVAGLTALAWITRPLTASLLPAIEISDGGIAMAAAVALFVLPAGRGSRRRLLDWPTAAGIRWDVLLLVGGGLALASGIEQSGLASWIGAQSSALKYWPEFLVLLAIAATIVYLGELASNTAMAAIFLPVAGAMAIGTGADPLTFALPVALAASIGFMLPVATPPNAIVFGNPAVGRVDMLRAGAILNPIGLVVALAAGMIIGPLVF
nr:DASS family sodium-coupled anion symporter [Minwuia thermotolerans]